MFAQGGEADLYQLDSHRLLRVPRSGHADFSIETALFPQLAAHHIPIPTFYGVTTYHGRPAQIIEQIDGPSALSELMRHPLHLAGFMRSFSALHEKILSIPGPANLPSLREQLYTLQAQPERLPKKDLLSILRLFDTLPKGNRVCHGDFHPGNLLTCRGQTYVIDWGLPIQVILCRMLRTRFCCFPWFLVPRDSAGLPGGGCKFWGGVWLNATAAI